MSATNRGSDYRDLADYSTPDDLAEVLVSLLDIGPGEQVMEPHVGGGAFVRAILRKRTNKEFRLKVLGMDLNPLAEGLALCDEHVVGDFLTWNPAPAQRPDRILGNPPFGPGKGVAEAHVRHALDIVPGSGGVGFLLRLSFLASAERAPFWRSFPAFRIWVLSERPSFTGGGTDATDYAFFLWCKGYRGSPKLDVLSWKGERKGKGAA